MTIDEEYKGCRNYKYQPEPMQTCDWIKHKNEVYIVCPMWELKETKVWNDGEIYGMGQRT